MLRKFLREKKRETYKLDALNLWCRRIAFCICLLVSFLKVSGLYAETSVITIDNAEKTSYRKNADTGNDEIVLTGAVSVSVVCGETKVNISAVSVIYDRSIDMLFAQGNVVLEQSGAGEGGQTITADTLLFNTSTMEGIFDNGRVIQTQSDAINLPADSTLVVSSSMFGRDSSNTVTFENGELTFCDDDNPHWKIKASRIWLLPGGEFAFFNALLYVGVVPVLYLPAFYYPKDELIFNPVFGYNERRGYYTQTTTYILGRKPLDSSSSNSDDEKVSSGLYNFLRPSSLKEQVQEGLVLHNLDEDYKGSTDNYLKIMADHYSNLGNMIGIDGSWKPSEYISLVEGYLNIGFSNTVFSINSKYTPYGVSGKKYMDKTNFIGFEVPFRFSGNFKLTLNKPFKLTLALPVYSDPFFVEDFGEREETMDWISYFLSGVEDKSGESTSETTSQVSSFTWSLSGSYNHTLPEAVKPYLSTLSLGNVSSSISFSSKEVKSGILSDTDSYSTFSPSRMFFYPSVVTPIKVSGKIAGTIFTTEKKQAKVSSSKNPKMALPMNVPEDLDDSSPEDGDDKDVKAAASEEESVLAEKDLPALDISSVLTLTEMSGLEYSLLYSVSPQFSSQISYSSSSFDQASDFAWDKYQSTYYQVKSPLVLTSNLSYDSTFASLKNTFTFNPVYQDHPDLAGYSESSAESIRRSDYNALKLDLTNDNVVSVRPFLHNSYFKNTGLDWNSTIQLVRTQFVGDADNPEWEFLTMDLTDDECVTTHTLGATIGINETDKIYQTLVLTTTLPPQLDSYYGTLNLYFPHVKATVSTGVKKVEVNSSDSKYEWRKQDLNQGLSVSLFSDKLTLSESYNYNLEKNYSDSLKFALAWNGLQVAYTMQYTTSYMFDDGWIAKTNEDGSDVKEFQPYTFSIAYASTNKTFHYWKNRISYSPGVSTSLVYDCLKPTDSYFKFVPNMTFQINKFLNVKFASETINNVVFRYMQKYTNLDIEDIPGETNVFKDLFNSFKFWSDDAFWDPNQTARKSSGFKLKSLSMTLTHELCDWDMSATYKFSPRLTTDQNNKKYYDFKPYFSLSVTWRPMSSMKAEIVDKYGTWEVNP